MNVFTPSGVCLHSKGFMIKVSTTGMVVSSKMDLRFPDTGQQGHGRRIIQHVFEFLIIGICVSIFYAFAAKNIWTMLVLAVLTCMCISLCDQSVRIFIAGRHFDSFDLVLDSLGYVSAIVVVSICRGIYRLVVNRDK